MKRAIVAAVVGVMMKRAVMWEQSYRDVVPTIVPITARLPRVTEVLLVLAVLTVASFGSRLEFWDTFTGWVVL